jgi:two-component system, NtrC family, response regulator AtoC
MSKGQPEARVWAPLCLIVSAPGGAQSIAVLAPGTTYSVGRSPASDICIDDPRASEHHAVVRGGEPPTIVDLDSEHGTLVDGKKLGPGTECVITEDSAIVIGQTVVKLARSRSSGTHAIVAPEPGARQSGSYASSATHVIPAGELPSPLRSKVMRRVHGVAAAVAASNVSVLILGETGVGKEVMARMIHARSERKDRPLVSLNCAAIPENLVESELFGHERGAFSGAVATKPGIFEVADGTTLFLDEIGDLPLSAQAKLLRVLDTGEVRRLGAVRPCRVDVRVIAATNRDIQVEVANRRFRSDLFYRLNGMTIALPPLRQRLEDVLPLSTAFAAELSAGGAVPAFSPAAIARLEAHSWPGNVRELRAVIQRALLLARGEEIDVAHLVFDALLTPSESSAPLADERRALGFSASEPPTSAVAAKLHAELEGRERRRIVRALEQTGGSQKAAAELLGISRRTLINRLERLGVPRPRKHGASLAPAQSRRPIPGSMTPSPRKSRH